MPIVDATDGVDRLMDHEQDRMWFSCSQLHLQRHLHSEAEAGSMVPTTESVKQDVDTIDDECSKTPGLCGATGLHFDPYENFFFMLEGAKRIAIYPPWEKHLLYTDEHQSASGELHLPLDPFAPDYERYPLLRQATPRFVDVYPGEVLFLPAFWWHHVVALSPSSQAVSSWYSALHHTPYTMHCTHMYPRTPLVKVHPYLRLQPRGSIEILVQVSRACLVERISQQWGRRLAHSPRGRIPGGVGTREACPVQSCVDQSTGVFGFWRGRLAHQGACLMYGGTCRCGFGCLPAVPHLPPTAHTPTKWDVHRAGLARYRQGVVGGWRGLESIRASGALHGPRGRP
jgi:hypothetical protein